LGKNGRKLRKKGRKKDISLQNFSDNQKEGRTFSIYKKREVQRQAEK
jgi:hypothetical protein